MSPSCGSCSSALGVSDARMEQGSLRCDVNLSLAPKGADKLGTRTETKNVNSLRSVERAVRYEMQRHGARPGLGGLDPPGDSALARGHRDHHQRPREVRRRGLPLLPRARPGAGRSVSGVGRGAARARCPSRRASTALGCRPTGASPTWRCATPSVPERCYLVEETIAAGATPQSARKWWLGELARRANDAGLTCPTCRDARPGRCGPGAGRRRHAQRQAGAPGLRRPAGGRGHARGDRRGPRAGASSPTTARSARRSTMPSRPTPTSPTRSATARSPPPGRSSVR